MTGRQTLAGDGKVNTDRQTYGKTSKRMRGRVGGERYGETDE